MVEEKDGIRVERLNVLERREKHRGGLRCEPLFYLHFLMVEQVKAIWSSCQILAEFDGGCLCMGFGGIYVCSIPKSILFFSGHIIIFLSFSLYSSPVPFPDLLTTLFNAQAAAPVVRIFQSN